MNYYNFFKYILLWCANLSLVAGSEIATFSYVKLDNLPDVKEMFDKKRSVMIIKVQESGNTEIFKVIKGSPAKIEVSGQMFYNLNKTLTKRTDAGDLYCLYCLDDIVHDVKGMINGVTLGKTIAPICWEKPPDKIPLYLLPLKNKALNSTNDPIRYLKIDELIKQYCER